jgi:DNA/RNA endonuclease YhcR with UshA esterase domain
MGLEKIALITAILGIAALIVMSQTLEPKARTVGSITSKDIENYVKISGNITSIKNYPTSVLFKMDDGTGTIYSIFYGNANLTKGPATVTGKIVQYKGILEIQAEKIQTK